MTFGATSTTAVPSAHADGPTALETPRRTHENGRRAEAVPATAVAGAELTIRKLVIGVGFGWFIAQALASVGPLADVPLAVVVACLVANSTALVIYAVTGRGWVLAWVLSGSALTIALASGPVLTLAAAPLVMLWVNQATTSIGFLYSGRRGGALVLACAVVIVGTFTWHQGVMAAGPGQFVPLAFSLLAIALADGWSAAAATGAMRSMARRSDAAARDLDEALSAAAGASACEREGQRIARLLHDNVINTLVAIRSLRDLPADVIRERCLFDLRQLDDQDQSPAADTADLVARLRERGHLLGITMSIRTAPDEALAPAVADALEGAVGEWLNNVAKHTPGRRAELSLGPGVLVVRDRGIGVTADALGTGGRRSILDRCHETGIRVDLGCEASPGTTATFDWSMAEPEAPRAQEESVESESLTPVMAQITLRLCLFMSIVGVSSTIVEFGSPGSLGNVAGMMMMAALIWWSYRVSRGRGPSRWPWPIYFLFAMAVSALPGLGADGCSRVGPWWWGPLAGLSASIAAVLIDGRRVAVVAALAGYLVGDLWVILDAAQESGACAYDTSALLILDVGVVVAVIFFRRAIADTWQKLTTQRAQARQVRIDTAIAQAADQTRRTQSQRALSVARRIMDDVASGRLDPSDAAVREHCARTEAVLRALIAIPPSLGRLGQGLADLVVAVGPDGPVVHINADVLTPIDDAVVDDILATLSAAGSGLDPADPVSITVVTRGAELVVLSSARVSAGWEAPATDDHWTTRRVGDTVMLSARWEQPQ